MKSQYIVDEVDMIKAKEEMRKIVNKNYKRTFFWSDLRELILKLGLIFCVGLGVFVIVIELIENPISLGIISITLIIIVLIVLLCSWGKIKNE